MSQKNIIPDLISTHGHTVFHKIKERISHQIGNPFVLYNSLNIPIVYNLSGLFLGEFLKKLKRQFIPGFSDRTLDSDLNENLFIKQAKDFYSSAKDYYRLSLDYDENSSTITKEYKKKMRKDIRKIDEQIIPTLEGMLK